MRCFCFTILILSLIFPGILFAVSDHDHLYMQQDTFGTGYIQRFETSVPDSFGKPVPMTVRFVDTVILSVELNGRIIPEEEYSMYEEQIFGPVRKQQQLQENIRVIRDEIEEIRQKLLLKETDTAFVYELDPEQKTRLALLAEDISVHREKAGELLAEALQTGNMADLKYAINLAKEEIMAENVPETDSAGLPGTETGSMDPETREDLLDKLDSMNSILDNLVMKNKDLVTEEEQQLQDELMRKEDALLNQENRLAQLQMMFVREPLPEVAPVKSRDTDKKAKKRKRRKRKNR